ncbi:unnamed protein product [Macrosiphum euphorbiae]|uniref:Uncharacterized protein n=1 Tax=Macrosiphum euphorbiae TaxID=13131 RepID=A0AAV0WXN3_9HEMI|nr:unnamed protein product [Macrosiphum euphorbiae]
MIRVLCLYRNRTNRPKLYRRLGNSKTGVGETPGENESCRRHVISVKTHKTPPGDLRFGRQGGRKTAHVGSSRPRSSTHTAAGHGDITGEPKDPAADPETRPSRISFSVHGCWWSVSVW